MYHWLDARPDAKLRPTVAPAPAPAAAAAGAGADDGGAAESNGGSVANGGGEDVAASASLSSGGGGWSGIRPYLSRHELSVRAFSFLLSCVIFQRREALLCQWRQCGGSSLSRIGVSFAGVQSSYRVSRDGAQN